MPHGVRQAFGPSPHHPISRKATMTSRTAYIEKIKLQLDELNSSMTHLEARAHEARRDARATYDEEIAKLHHQSKLAVVKLDEITASTEEGWRSMVAEMEKVREAFVHSFSYFKSQI
jgi:uncharacterized protein YukE